MSFVQSVIITSKPGNTDKILKYLTDIKTEAEEKEPGTLKFHAAQSLDDDNVIYLWEEYESEEALATHRAGKAYQTFFAVRDDLMAHAVKIQRCRPL